MQSVFARQDRTGRSMTWGIVIVAAVLAPLATWLVSGIRLQNDIESWFPSNDAQVAVVRWYQKTFPAADRILVSWDGSSLDDPRIDRLVEFLRTPTSTAGADVIGTVIAPQALIEKMTAYGVPHEEALKRVRGVLVGKSGAVGVAVTLAETGTGDRTAALAYLRHAAASAGIPAGDLQIGGGPTVATELDAAVGRLVWNTAAPLWNLPQRSPLLFSGMVGAVLAFVMLRSLRLSVIVIAVAILATLLTMALIPATSGMMNMILVIVPPLLLVVTLSGAIHVSNYWRHAPQDNPRLAVAHAVKVAAGPCALASATTAIGLLTLWWSPLAPVRSFGLYAAVGCVISLAVVLFVMPALLTCWPSRRRRRQAPLAARWERLGELIARNHGHAALGFTVVFAFGVVGFQWFETESKLIKYFPESSRVVRDYSAIEKNVAGVVPVEMVVRFQKPALESLEFIERLEIVRTIQNEMRNHADITGALSLADFQPVSARPGADADFFAKAAFHKKSHELARRVRAADAEAAAPFFKVADASADLYEAGDHALAARGDELWRITAQAPLMGDVDYEALTADLDWMAHTVLKHHQGTDYIVTGMVPMFLRTQSAVLQSLIQSFALAFTLIALVMAVLLRSPVAGALSMLPNVLPIGLVFGLISWGGLAVDIGTMITASIALGIAVDGTLHLLTWFKHGLAEGLSRADAVARAMGHCGPALWQTSVVVALGLVVLAPSELLLVSRFGWLMAALIGAALAAELVFLPALLAGPLGWLIQRTTAPARVTSIEEELEGLGLEPLAMDEGPALPLATTNSQ